MAPHNKMVTARYVAKYSGNSCHQHVRQLRWIFIHRNLAEVYFPRQSEQIATLMSAPPWTTVLLFEIHIWGNTSEWWSRLNISWMWSTMVFVKRLGSLPPCRAIHIRPTSNHICWKTYQSSGPVLVPTYLNIYVQKIRSFPSTILTCNSAHSEVVDCFKSKLFKYYK